MTKRIQPTVDLECPFCGVPFRALRGNIISGRTKSCGCWRRKASSERGRNNITHGLWGSRIYKSWERMLSRVRNSNNDSFKYYGGRGIKCFIKSPQEIIDAIGDHPGKGWSIDRINNDGHYEIGNIRWATSYEQIHNRRCSV